MYGIGPLALRFNQPAGAGVTLRVTAQRRILIDDSFLAVSEVADRDQLPSGIEQPRV